MHLHDSGKKDNYNAKKFNIHYKRMVNIKSMLLIL